MTAFRISVAAQAQASAHANVGTQDIGEQIRQSIQDAAQQARDAAQQVRDAQQHVWDAQRQVREAERQVRDARTADATRQAETALRDAKASLQAAQAEAGGINGPMVIHTGQMQPDLRGVIPPQAVDISIAFFVMVAAIIIGWPLARAFGKRIERRDAVAGLEPGVSSQLQRIEQAVDAMAIEIERISESQRFMAKLQSDSAQRAVMPSGERR
jgi:hypothetical protein